MIRGVVVLGAVLLLSSCMPSSPDLADPTMPGETGGSEETRPYESTPGASSMALAIEAEDSAVRDSNKYLARATIPVSNIGRHRFEA